ncbi:hypothetical protein CSUI_011014, partial [Cystoisospora suis]
QSELSLEVAKYMPSDEWLNHVTSYQTTDLPDLAKGKKLCEIFPNIAGR